MKHFRVFVVGDIFQNVEADNESDAADVAIRRTIEELQDLLKSHGVITCWEITAPMGSEFEVQRDD